MWMLDQVDCELLTSSGFRSAIPTTKQQIELPPGRRPAFRDQIASSGEAPCQKFHISYFIFQISNPATNAQHSAMLLRESIKIMIKSRIMKHSSRTKEGR